MEAIPRQFESYDWITLILVGILVILVVLKEVYPYNLKNFRKILSSDQYFAEKEKIHIGFGVFESALYLIQALIISVGLYLLIFGIGWIKEVSFILFVKIFIGYFIFMIAKYLVERIVGELFDMKDFLDQYVFFKLTYRNFISLCFYPVIVILFYFWEGTANLYKILLLAFVFLNTLSLLFYYQKQRKIIYSNLFHFILYLCTFEIAPYFILYKVVAETTFVF